MGDRERQRAVCDYLEPGKRDIETLGAQSQLCYEADCVTSGWLDKFCHPLI